MIKGKESDRKERDSLRKEFYFLRKSTGLADWKLEHLTTLPSLIANVMGVTPNGLSSEQLKAYLIHEIDALSETKEARALNNAFALNQNLPDTLTERRQQLATKLGKHIDTIEAYENRAITMLIRRLISSNLPHILAPSDSPAELPISKPCPSLDSMETAMRSLVSQGLGHLLAIDNHTSELLRCFSPNTSPYMDTSVEWLLLPSNRGKDWFSQRLRYTFRRQKDYFRVAITHSALDGETLMISGIVDEVIKLDRSPSHGYEMVDLLQNMLFITKEENGRQQIFSFTEIDQATTQQLLGQLWQIDSDNCRLVEVRIPKEKIGPHTTYEYRLTYHIHTHEQYAYWYSPGLMFLNNIVVDVSRFPEREKWNMHILPFFGHVFPGTIESTGDRFTMPANSWIMQGHGIALSWQKRDET